MTLKALFAVIFAVTLALPLFAQTDDTPSRVENIPGTSTTAPQKSRELTALLDIWSDQKNFWTRPVRAKSGDVHWLLPLLVGTSLLVGADRSIEGRLPNGAGTIKNSQRFSDVGTGSLLGVAGLLYMRGRLTHDDRATETGLLAGEAAVDSLAISSTLQLMSGRERPGTGDNRGRFFQGGNSFPSNHAAVAWSAATVIASEYPGPLTKLLAYGTASAISISRITGRMHYASDVVIGSTLGWYLGRQVFRTHHSREPGSEYGDLTGMGEAPRTTRNMGSPQVALDSWVYPALDKLVALGFVRTSFAGLRPWTRLECARLVGEAAALIEERDGTANPVALDLLKELQHEFAYESRLMEGQRNLNLAVDSIYARAISISGPALTDGFHLGQTISYDYGRPFERGLNSQVGSALEFSVGPFTGYLRSEYQHAPAAPPLSQAVQQVVKIDQVPVLANLGRASTTNRFQVLDAYLAVNVENWQFSFGRQSLSWGPGPGGSLLWSNNAQPVEMFRLVNGEPIRLPALFGFLGPARIDQFIGRLRGHSVIPHPYIFGQKISFKPFSFLELGFGRTTTLGGSGGMPFTTRNFLRSLFGQIDPSTKSVPGDNHSGMDWTFYVPKLRNYVVLYGELYADDDFLPIQNPAKNPFRPGIYLTHIPGVPRLDFHMEAAVTDASSTHLRNLNYWNGSYPEGYTNNGNLLGNTVGRMGRTIECWSTYWFSPRVTLQSSYKHSSISDEFLPGGASWQDYGVAGEIRFSSGIYLKPQLQYEHISRYPLLFPSARSNVAAVVEIGFFPRRHE